jgi:hypothetical protein
MTLHRHGDRCHETVGQLPRLSHMSLLTRLLGAFGTRRGTRPLPTLGPASNIDEVISSMRMIQASLDDNDGVAHFNRMYLHVTEGVAAAVARRDFEDRAFLERLDVVFANYYFRALAQCAGPDACPRAWQPLIECRAKRRIAPIQFALAGMNAHINYDLALAVVDTCVELGCEPRRDTSQYRDFLLVNALLAKAKDEIEPTFKRGLLGVIDNLLGRGDEAAEMWSIERARDAAWVNAEALWKLKDDPLLSERFTLILARTVGLAGRGLLIPSAL